MTYYKHPNALVETDNIGRDTRIWAFSHILQGAVIGENCNINDQTFIENDVIIGNNVTVKSGVYIWDGVRIEDNVFIGPNVTFTNDLKPRSKQYPKKFEQTIIEEWASIGANATIIAGNRIGKYSMIGAGSVVTKDIPNNTLWYGNPAKMRGYVCNCGEKLTNELKCNKCKKNYEYVGKEIKLIGE
ncbi:acyltransferase [Paenibacillus validus]|uniref:acyltransferase n=1 Tax=Paenibacillus TaxID=44249 RepID=UPI000FD9B767|nr:acyltransferase [Paenibacillus validus]MED4599482.1 acyltransferase [Paenibacillus validus]MED4606722.1 acyltransferase [Paenibacillus validus]